MKNYKLTSKNDLVNAYSFMGLLANEGQVPGYTSAPLEALFLADGVDAAWRLVSGSARAASETSDFFDLMVASGQMKARV